MTLLNNKIEILDSKNIKENFTKYNKYKYDLVKIEGVIDNKKLIIKSKLDKLSKLEEHEYNPNCSFCINNIFVKLSSINIFEGFKSL